MSQSRTSIRISAAAFRKDPAGFWDQLEPLVRYIARRFGLQESDAEDLAQDTFIKVLNRIGQLKGNPVNWVASIARRTALDALRIESRRRSHTAGSLDAQGDDVHLDPRSLDPLEELLNQEDHACLREGLAYLPAEQQTILALRYEEEMGFDQIAERLDIPRGSVGYRLGLAQESLRQTLAC